ncbi:MAG: S46 family peptidase [Bacteroidetes bacterium]|jgi:hypothetical protein|nr:S46 family peptidase [Bacteroidota bacterium]
MKRFLLVFTLIASSLALADEGMYPISEIHKLNLKKLGFLISQKDLYNPNGVSLLDAIVNVGGCSGSFISKDGLVITNHHCVFGAVQAISTKENDYITDGFLAATRDKEVPARGLVIRITESYKDVSKEVLSVVTPNMPLADRTRAINKKMQEIAEAVEKANPGKQAQVSEMFAGRNYVLFVYQRIRDVRLVYVPQRSIGEFAGENDNWVWPRHTGDFSFVRAYVAKDGTPAEYSADNVAYQPKKFLKVNPNGVDDGDFVFILGYPGRTFRHQPAAYIAYDETFRLKFTADLYEWQIATMEAAGKGDRAVAIKHDARIKGLANTMKNFQGKLTGLKRLRLAEGKQAEEEMLQKFIEADAKRKEVYGTVLADINAVYAEMSATAPREMVLDAFGGLAGQAFSTAAAVLGAAIERAKPDDQRMAPWKDANVKGTIEGRKRAFRDYYEPTDRAFFKDMLQRALALPEGNRIAGLAEVVGADVETFVAAAYANTILTKPDSLEAAFAMTEAQVQASNDNFIRLAWALRPAAEELRETRARRTGALNRLLALYVEVKEQFVGKDFIPDANSTLRLTYGRIKGYSPSDATYYSPITTLKGVLEKTTGEEPYNTPPALLEAAQKQRDAKFMHKKLNDIPVAILYNTDTTGGNSGSAVMNAKGELVGVNFDRAYHATINDYAWSDSYSRSIAVDIRYVLWVTKYVGNAGFILKEIGVE